MGELWGVYCEYFRENQQCYNKTVESRDFFHRECLFYDDDDDDEMVMVMMDDDGDEYDDKLFSWVSCCDESYACY